MQRLSMIHSGIVRFNNFMKADNFFKCHQKCTHTQSVIQGTNKSAYFTSKYYMHIQNNTYIILKVEWQATFSCSSHEKFSLTHLSIGKYLRVELDHQIYPMLRCWLNQFCLLLCMCVLYALLLFELVCLLKQH